MADALPLSIVDAESAQEGITQLLLDYTHYPSSFISSRKNILWNNTLKGASIGLFPLQGAVYLRKYISGSYQAQFPFQLVFKSNPTNNEASLQAQKLVDDLGRWLEKCAIGFRDTHVTFEQMNRTTPSFILAQNDTTTEFAINMQLIYSYK